MKARHHVRRRLLPIFAALVPFGAVEAFAEEWTLRPATVIRIQPQTIGDLQFYWVDFRIEPKTRTRNAKSIEARLDTTSTKIVTVSPSGHRRSVTRDALKPGQRVLLSGYPSISSASSATAIQILETKE